jgi:aminoglycoside 2''-phosphotransferase
MDPTTAARYIEETIPQFRVSAISLEGEGDFSVAFTVNGDWIFRFAKNDEGSRSIECEARLFSMQGPRLALAVPHIEHLGRWGERALRLAGHRKIQGVELDRERLAALAPQEKERAIEDLARFLTELHSFSLDAAREAGVRECEYPFCRTEEGITPGSAAEQYNDALARLKQFPQQRPDMHDYCTRLVERLLQPENSFPPALVHGDLSADHILFEPASGLISGVIDFSDVVITDPMLDVMYLYASYGPDFLGRFVEHYSPEEAQRSMERVRTMYEWYTALRLLWALEHSYQPGITLRLEQLDALRKGSTPC